MTTMDVMFSKKSDEWATPQDFFDRLNEEFSFVIDAAATADNTKCHLWFGPGGVHDDALVVAEWGRGPVFLNPPYSRCYEFVSKAAEQRVRGTTTVLLIPARTDTRFFHQYIYDPGAHRFREGMTVRFMKGRLKFGGGANSAPFPSMLVIMRP